MSEKTEKKEGFFKKIFTDKKKRLIFIICAATALVLIAGGIVAGTILLGGGSVDKSEYDLHLSNGNSYFANGQYAEAITEFKCANELDSGEIDAYYMLAISYKKLDDMDSAKKILSEGIEKTASDKLKELYLNYFKVPYGTPEETTAEETTAEDTIAVDTETSADETTTEEAIVDPADTDAYYTDGDSGSNSSDGQQSGASSSSGSSSSSSSDNAAQDTMATETNPSGEEILGAGSASQPYLEIPDVNDNSMSVTTVTIPSGKSLFYGIYRVGSMILTINNPNAYVVCNGTRYDAQGGSLTMTVPAALASEAVIFEVGNTGGDASFTLVFTNVAGSQANPVIISSMGADNTVNLPEGDSDGYYYKYIAEKSGTIRFTMTASADSILSVTNNRNSAQRTTEADLVEGTNYIELEVSAGDEIVILVGAKPNMRNQYPAATITWNGKYN